MTIFYFKNNGQDLVSINLSSKPTNNIVKKNNFTILKNDEEIVGFNIFNVQNFPSKEYGLIYPTDEVKNWIEFVIDTKDIKYVDLFVVAKVISCEPIPKTHLHKCLVWDGSNQYDVVCGASNVEKNAIVVYAKLDAIMPSGLQITPRKLGADMSYGMLCGGLELGLENITEKGLYLINDENEIGKPFLKMYKNTNNL